MDLTQDSPELQRLLSKLGSNQSSHENARQVVWDALRLKIDPKRIERVTLRVGEDRLDEVQALNSRFEALPLAEKEAAPPELLMTPQVVAIQIDGGRYQTRTPAPAEDAAKSPQAPNSISCAPAETASPEASSAEALPENAATKAEPRPSHWREDKIGVLLTLCSQPSAEDSCPQVPKCFLDIAYSQKLATEIKNARAPDPGEEFHGVTQSADADPATPPAAEYAAPQVITRQVIATPAKSAEFSLQLAAQAWAAGFFAAARRAFLGDGQPYNWTIWRARFPTFTPILDFIHLLTYIFAAAFAGRNRVTGAPIYQQWIQWAWSGQIPELIAALSHRLAELGPAVPNEPDTSPRRVVAKTLEYIKANQTRMNYPEYRRQGLPMTTCLVESTVKQINFRVKGTEKFWSTGGHAVLQLRADSLSDVRTLDDFYHRREKNATGRHRYRMRTRPTAATRV